MGKVRIRLMCMNGGGLSPGSQSTHFLDNENATETYLFHTSEGPFVFRDVSEEVDWETVDALAKFSQPSSSSSFNIVFEPLASGVFIEPDITPRLAGLIDSARISVPPTSEGERHFVHLRPNDTINFSEHGLKVAVMAEIADTDSSQKMSSHGGIVITKQPQTEVQVKSSNADSEVASDGDHDEEPDSSDDDLDQPVLNHAAGDITPATARTSNLTVMETPTTKPDSESLVREDQPLYSTAQETPSGDTAMPGDDEPASPAAQAQQKRAAKADTSQKDDPLAAMELADSNGTLPDFDVKIESDSLDTRTSPDPAATSEPYELRQVAFTAASASMAAAGTAPSSLSTKRKASQDDQEDDLSVSSKKRKANAPRMVDEQYESDEIDGTSLKQDDDNDDDADAVPQARVAPVRKTGRSAKSARRPTRSRSPTGSKQENSSPIVVVAAQRTTRQRTSTMSPTSSASSPLTDKVPHILLSNDSACRKGATAAFLKKHGATIIDDVKTRRTHFVCVLKGDRLTTTAKVLRSLALGKLVVTEDWITKSKNAGQLLGPEGFVHEDLQPTMNVDRRTIFQDKNLFFTKALVKAYGKGWKDIQDLAKEAGASHVEEGDSGSFGHLKEGRMEVICFGKEEDDIDVPRLRKTHRVKVYHKNLLTQSILKGELDVDGEEHVLSA